MGKTGILESEGGVQKTQVGGKIPNPKLQAISNQPIPKMLENHMMSPSFWSARQLQ
jgi:hypothetical protein